MTLKLVRRNSGDPFADVRLKRGMPVVMSDGWTGKVTHVADGLMHCEKDGPNPHWTGRAVKRGCLKIKDGKVMADWSPVRSGPTKVSKTNREQRRAVVVDLGRARLEAEWKYAPED
jgi:hypothetical protein